MPRVLSFANESEPLPACLSHLRVLPSKLSRRGVFPGEGHVDDGGAGGLGRRSDRMRGVEEVVRRSRPGAGAEATPTSCGAPCAACGSTAPATAPHGSVRGN